MDFQPSVVFVDDDDDLRNANRQTLELAGFAVVPFADAMGALRFLTPDFAGVVVTDVRMPHIDGLELFRRLRAMDGDLPVILITGHDETLKEARSNLPDARYPPLLKKPFDGQTLLAAVAAALGSA